MFKKSWTEEQSRSWVFTISQKYYEREEIEQAFADYSFVYAQLEEGKERKEGAEHGYYHWQGMLENATPIRGQTLKNKLSSAHFNPRRGSLGEALAYVTKEETRVPDVDPILIGEFPDRPGKGHRTDVDRVRTAILEDGRSPEDVLLTMPEAYRLVNYVERLAHARDVQNYGGNVERELVVWWLWGAPGTGKTHYAVKEIPSSENEEEKTFFRVTDYGHPFDGYQGQDILILDEFDGSMPLSVLLNVLDKWGTELPARYHNKVACYRTVVVISNVPPWCFYQWEQPARRAALARRIHVFMEFIGQGGSVKQVWDSVQCQVKMGWADQCVA